MLRELNPTKTDKCDGMNEDEDEKIKMSDDEDLILDRSASCATAPSRFQVSVVWSETLH